MQRMARSRRNMTIPSVATRSMDVVKTFRMPVELAEEMEKARGLIPESAWLRDLVTTYLATREKLDLIEVRDLMCRRGVTLEQLTSFLKNEPK